MNFLYYTKKKIKRNLMFLDVGNVYTYEWILSKFNEIHMLKFLSLIHGLIVECIFISCSYANDTEEYHIDFKISTKDMISIIIFIKNKAMKNF